MNLHIIKYNGPLLKTFILIEKRTEIKIKFGIFIVVL